jgi:hypothetical protein
MPFSYKIKSTHSEPSMSRRTQKVCGEGEEKGPKSIMVNVISLARMEKGGF